MANWLESWGFNSGSALEYQNTHDSAFAPVKVKVVPMLSQLCGVHDIPPVPVLSLLFLCCLYCVVYVTSLLVFFFQSWQEKKERKLNKINVNVSTN